MSRPRRGAVLLSRAVEVGVSREQTSGEVVGIGFRRTYLWTRTLLFISYESSHRLPSHGVPAGSNVNRDSPSSFLLGSSNRKTHGGAGTWSERPPVLCAQKGATVTTVGPGGNQERMLGTVCAWSRVRMPR